ncbi:MAG: ComF family protein [Phycisphaerales bacterium]|nr:ComF family protein [Phycisphaerales bacterium]
MDAEDHNPGGSPESLPAGSSTAERFVWPPLKPTTTSPTEPPTQPPARPSPQTARPTNAGIGPSPLSTAITQIERTWLGLVSSPWPIRSAEAGWSPNTPEEYCWRCGRTVGPFEVTPPESADPGCTGCRGTRPPWSRFIRLGDYAGVLREAILEIKFAQWRRLGHTLGVELGRAIERRIEWAAADGTRIDRERLFLVPIPAPLLRRMRMGIDHTLVLARGVRSVVGGRIIRPIARRHSPSQLEVPPSQRQRNAAGSFVASRRWLPGRWGGLGRLQGPELAGATLIAIDDVKTTGATMTAGCRSLLAAIQKGWGVPNKQLPQIWAATVGVTPEREARDDTGDVADSLSDFAPLT